MRPKCPGLDPSGLFAAARVPSSSGEGYRGGACRTEGPFWVKPWLKPSIKIQQSRLDRTQQIAATCGDRHNWDVTL